jgi:outer membrane immunogenic protein
MKKILLGMTVIAGLMAGGAAQAADMPIKAPARAPDCCVYANFGGWYLGVHGGGGVASEFGGTLHDDGLTADEPLTARKRTFGLVGLHGGYNWQMGQAVVGIEGDYSWVNARNTVSVAEDGSFDVASAKLQSLASVRGRAGAVFGNLFVYGTAGWGWARTKFHFNDVDEPPALSISRTTSGIVGGVGVEWYLTKFGPGSLLLRSEWLHYAFGGQAVDTRIGPIGSDSFVTTKPPTSVDVLRAGLTWKFP